MRTLSGIAISLALAAGIAGCGGSSSGSRSPYAGTFGGTWSDPTFSGTLNIVVDSRGHATGTQVTTGTETSGPVTLDITRLGVTTGTAEFIGWPSYPVVGTMVMSNGGSTMTGSLTGEGILKTYVLTKQ